MTVTNFDSKNESKQAPYDFSLVHASDLLTQMNDIQNFLCSSAICELEISVGMSLQERQSELLSEVSMIVYQNTQQSKSKN